MTTIEAPHKLHAAMLGNPIHEERQCTDGIGRYRSYQHGSIHHHPHTGTCETHGGIRDFWGRLGWENGFLGYPVSDERDYSTDDYIIGVMGDPYMEDYPDHKVLGRCSFFQGGCIVWFSDPEARANFGEFLPFLRPHGIGNWLPIYNEPEKSMIGKALSFFSNEPTVIRMNQVRYQDIPANYGRSIWQQPNG